ncbi:hypothetical protein NE237_000729 [Protea cynaroides]|uniref:Uncharacterized protein n=1 Tax=Protea cynaroides TaxID=273540 RepID=A0A9Q0KRU3_9MAGN|nr:hypothetical protein NE237_000729 [Protea cynaroides]
MARGRAPCCDKAGLKKGPWTPEEDLRLIAFIQKHGHGNWRALPKIAGLLRCGKSCRLRWTNYLRPDIKRGNFTKEEEETVIKLHEMLGNKWSKIASNLPGRTDNEIKNVWNTHLKKRLTLNRQNPHGNEDKEVSVTTSFSSSTSSISITSESNDHYLCVSENLTEALEKKHSSPFEEIPIQWNDFSDVFDNLERKEKDESKELLRSPSSSSCSSSILDSNRVDGPRLEEQIPDQILDIPYEPYLDVWDMLDNPERKEKDESKELLRSPSSSSCSSSLLDSNQVDGTTLEQRIPDQILDIPYEPYLDVWDMLEDDTSFSTSSVGPMYENEVHHQHLEDLESMSWVTDLENELGLQGTTCDAVEPLLPTLLTEEILIMKAENDPIGSYFQILPSSPLNFYL